MKYPSIFICFSVIKVVLAKADLHKIYLFIFTICSIPKSLFYFSFSIIIGCLFFELMLGWRWRLAKLSTEVSGGRKRGKLE